MYNNQLNNPTFSLHENEAETAAVQKKNQKSHSEDDASLEEDAKSDEHITIVPFPHTQTGSFQ